MVTYPHRFAPVVHRGQRIRGSLKQLLVALMVLGAFGAPAGATEERIIRKQVKAILGEGQTKEDVRVLAIARAKREALEEAGTYLESTTVLRDFEIASDEVLALSSGVLHTTVVREGWSTEGSVIELQVIAEIHVDTTTLAERVRQLLENRDHLERLKTSQLRLGETLATIQTLQAGTNVQGGEFAPGPIQREETLRRAVQELTAQQWYDRALGLWNGHAYVPEDEAMRAFLKAVTADLRFGSEYLATAFIRYANGHIRSGAPYMEAAVEMHPSAYSHISRGIFLMIQCNAIGGCRGADYRAAISAFESALALEPGNLVASAQRDYARRQLQLARPAPDR